MSFNQFCFLLEAERVRAQISELIQDLEDQILTDENGWSYRDGNNRFNEGAAFAERLMVNSLKEIIGD